MNIGNKNKGMYIEKLIDNSANYYLENNLILIEKKQIPFFFSKITENSVCGRIQKSTTDYYAIFNGIHFDFEVKQTNNDFLLLNIIKKHQMDYLLMINSFGGISFLLIHFFNSDHIYVIETRELTTYLKQNNKRVTEKYCQKNFYEVKIIFPGIINFKTLFSDLIKKNRICPIF